MPLKLDPHVALLEGWFAAEPQLTAVVGRLADLHPQNKTRRVYHELGLQLRNKRVSAGTCTCRHDLGFWLQAAPRDVGKSRWYSQ